jgi:L-ascorbate metabolism protein UlaG (beta-lactamase superfamily)
MFNKIALILIVICLIFTFIGLRLGFQSKNFVEENLGELKDSYQRLSQEIQLIALRVPPYVATGESVGFVIEFENNVKFYFASDTGLSSELEMIGRYFEPEVAFLPIGNIYTMDPKAAAFSAKIINPKEYIIPTNYGNFPEIEQTPIQFLEEVWQYGLDGEVLDFNIAETKEVLGIKVLWLGGKNWIIESPEGTRILINPGIKYNLDFPKEYRELVQLEDIDLVLIPNGHFDNFSSADVKKWEELFDPVFITPYELGIWLKSKLPNCKIVALNEGAKIGISEMRKLGIPEKNLEDITLNSIYVVPASHSSSVSPEGLFR